MKRFLTTLAITLLIAALTMVATDVVAVAQGGAPYFWTLVVRTTLTNYGTLTQTGTATFTGSVVGSPGYLAVSNDSLTLPSDPLVLLTGDSTGIVFLTAGTSGQVVRISAVDTTTALLVDGSNLALGGDRVVDNTNVTTLVYIGSNWCEASHAAN